MRNLPWNCCDDSGDSSCSVPAILIEAPQKAPCPSCEFLGRLIEHRTLLFQLKSPYQMDAPKMPFYFCAKTSCDVVYFSPGGTVYKQDRLRREVGQKSTDSKRTLCYCFDITEAVVRKELEQSGESRSKTFVMEQVKQKTCACDIQNPSGRCCLADFPKEISSSRKES